MSGVSSAGFSDHGVAGGERGGEPPGGDRHREVPRHDDPDDADRLVERDVDAPGDRDLAPDVALGRAGVVARGRRGRCPPRHARCRSCARRWRPRAPRARRGGRRPPRRSGAGAAPGPRGRPSRQAGSAARGPRDRRVASPRASARWPTAPSDLLGRRVAQSGVRAHSRSKPRIRSQSVTAEPNAASSTRAAWT